MSWTGQISFYNIPHLVFIFLFAFFFPFLFFLEIQPKKTWCWIFSPLPLGLIMCVSNPIYLHFKGEAGREAKTRGLPYKLWSARIFSVYKILHLMLQSPEIFLRENSGTPDSISFVTSLGMFWRQIVTSLMPKPCVNSPWSVSCSLPVVILVQVLVNLFSPWQTPRMRNSSQRCCKAQMCRFAFSRLQNNLGETSGLALIRGKTEPRPSGNSQSSPLQEID